MKKARFYLDVKVKLRGGTWVTQDERTGYGLRWLVNQAEHLASLKESTLLGQHIFPHVRVRHRGRVLGRWKEGYICG
jgi:hypothetical protein